jgi:hypothetical protein
VPNELYQCVGPTIEFETIFQGASNYQAGFEPTRYTLDILPTKRIPDGSLVQIVFPIELSLASGATNIVCDTYA